tara:strand:+ start:132 stop:545 length:414 start_codon:yes stop_codon:yes gene_type:complete
MAHATIKGQRKGLSVWNVGNKEYHKLYDTVIVIAEHLEDGSTRIRLNNGGWKTNHNKNCMNDFLKRFGFKVYQKDYKWYVKGREVSFEFETDMVYFEANPNNGSFVVGKFKTWAFRQHTVSSWSEAFNHGEYQQIMK